jgi:hypothetical protein
MKTKILFSSVAILFVLFVTSCQQKNNEATKTSVIDTTGFAQFQAWKAMQAQPAPAPIAATTHRTTTARRHTTSMSSSSSNAANVSQKKGWSKAAKYSVIGGGGGAVLGALLNGRNRVAGGVIGGVVMGTAGYLYGRSRDRKDGRIQ